MRRLALEPQVLEVPQYLAAGHAPLEAGYEARPAGQRRTVREEPGPVFQEVFDLFLDPGYLAEYVVGPVHTSILPEARTTW